MTATLATAAATWMLTTAELDSLAYQRSDGTSIYHVGQRSLLSKLTHCALTPSQHVSGRLLVVAIRRGEVEAAVRSGAVRVEELRARLVDTGIFRVLVSFMSPALAALVDPASAPVVGEPGVRRGMRSRRNKGSFLVRLYNGDFQRGTIPVSTTAPRKAYVSAVRLCKKRLELNSPEMSPCYHSYAWEYLTGNQRFCQGIIKDKLFYVAPTSAKKKSK